MFMMGIGVDGLCEGVMLKVRCGDDKSGFGSNLLVNFSVFFVFFSLVEKVYSVDG